MLSPRENSHMPVSRKRKFSEISSLNSQPVKKRRYNPEEETNLWTTVKQYLKDPAGRPVPAVSCPICMQPIAIRGIPTLEPCPWKLADGSQKVGAVLPCAHIFCQECINSHISAQNELSLTGSKSCPSCRADLLFIGCLHTIPSQRLPVATSEDFSMVPLTIPELRPKEHLFPEDCWECVIHTCEEYVDVTLRFVSGNLYGIEYRLGEGPSEWENFVEESQVRMWNYLESQRGLPNWRNGSVPAELLRVTFAEEGNILPIKLTQGLNRDAILYTPAGEGVWYVPMFRSQGRR